MVTEDRKWDIAQERSTIEDQIALEDVTRQMTEDISTATYSFVPTTERPSALTVDHVRTAEDPIEALVHLWSSTEDPRAVRVDRTEDTSTRLIALVSMTKDPSTDRGTGAEDLRTFKVDLGTVPKMTGQGAMVKSTTGRIADPPLIPYPLQGAVDGAWP